MLSAFSSSFILPPSFFLLHPSDNSRQKIFRKPQTRMLGCLWGRSPSSTHSALSSQRPARKLRATEAPDSPPRKQTGPINAPPVRLLDLCFVTLTEDGSAGQANPSTKRLFRRIFKRFYRADSGTGIDL